jgi:hypothetical protein
MQKTINQNEGLPFRCPMLCVSLAIASLMLIAIISLYSMDYISSNVAMWATFSVFLLAAVYESALVFTLVRHMINKVPKGS